MKIKIKDFVLESVNLLTGYDIIELYDKSLLTKAVAIKNGNIIQDIRDIVRGNDPEIQILTLADSDTLDVVRHTTAHLLAQAVKQLYDNVQLAIGPTIENGFYFDFLTEKAFEESDLIEIEKRMKMLIRQNIPIIKRNISKQDAIEMFNKANEPLKVELIESLSEEISVYSQGEFTDLCRGPHLPSTGLIPEHFKLTKVSGSYWKGDSSSHKLQRIYGVAFLTQNSLDEYICVLKESEKRDHRILGPFLGLFHIQEEAPGSIFWHHKGYSIYLTIEQYIRQRLKEDGYIEVKTPQLISRSLWEQSGHWDKYGENMFVIKDKENYFALKPMNCPAHIQIFKKHISSYKELPYRMAEFGCCHRNESSGSMHGLMRVRGFVQDDAHIFCTKNQISYETIKFCTLLKAVYKDFGFEDIKIRFADRPAKRAGRDDVWDLAEQSLISAAKSANLTMEYNKGDGAFYGPKLEFVLKDALNREWQCGTLQVDLILAERLGATFTNQAGEKEYPVLLHRAILGSIERFIGILIENYAGHFPLWLAPVQIALANITNDTDEYLNEIASSLKNNGIKVITDTTAEKISYKIRRLSEQKIPIIGIIGNKEAATRSISLRYFGSREEKTCTVEDLINEIKSKINSKS